MKLEFLAPDLRRFDESPTEILVAALFQDERPPAGAAALVNWRLAGRVERLLESGFLTGSLGEVLLLPGRPKFAADKVLLFGLGARAQFDEHGFASVTDHILRVLAGLAARTAAVELPGRHRDCLPAEHAADRFLTAAGNWGDAFDGFVLLERPEAQRRIEQHREQGRRRLR